MPWTRNIQVLEKKYNNEVIFPKNFIIAINKQVRYTRLNSIHGKIRKLAIVKPNIYIAQ